MSYSHQGYLARAEECARLANLSKDHLLRAELLKLRQSHLLIAERLKEIEEKSELGSDSN